MEIFEFLGGLEGLPPQNMSFVRNKIMLARQFGLAADPAGSLPNDVSLTRISNRAMDGYMAKSILGDVRLPGESFAHYAFTTCMIFAAQQLAIRSGTRVRRLDTEFCYFLFRSVDPFWRRVIHALPYIPFIMSQWVEDTRITPKEMPQSLTTSLSEFTKTFSTRKSGWDVEQCFQLVHFPEKSDGFYARQISSDPNLPYATNGKVGLFTLSQLKNANEYLLAFDRLRMRLSDCATLLIYDKRPVIDACFPALLASGFPWRGAALKYLTYDGNKTQDDYAIAALCANLAYIPELVV